MSPQALIKSIIVKCINKTDYLHLVLMSKVQKQKNTESNSVFFHIFVK